MIVGSKMERGGGSWSLVLPLAELRFSCGILIRAKGNEGSQEHAPLRVF